MVRHSVSEVSSDLQGRCSVCGPVKVYRNSPYKGRPSYRCSIAAIASVRRRQEEAPDVHRNARFQRLYGITVEQYDAMLNSQGGLCARCGQTSSGMRLAVDHCHDTGRVRGLLCGPCNTYLGRLEAGLGSLAGDLRYIGSTRSLQLADVIAQRLAEVSQ